MSRDLMDDDYYKASGGQIPIKWTAPEVNVFKICRANHVLNLLCIGEHCMYVCAKGL